MHRLTALKAQSEILQKLLKESQTAHAEEALAQLESYFLAIDKMESYTPLGKIRLLSLFLETDLSDDAALLSCYGKLANLIEGVQVEVAR